jgi:gas vesicle protein
MGESNKKGYFIGGILFGAFVGAIAGVLLAPSSGKETRKKIKKMADLNGEFVQNAKEKTEEVAHKTMDAIKTGFDKIGKYVEEKRGGNHPSGHHYPRNDDEAAA